MADEIVRALEEMSRQAADDIARDIHDELLDRLEGAEQGADGLAKYVELNTDEEGVAYVTINHPTAPLHEAGGHIEPTYSEAAMRGWTRDEFYDALEDCNEEVIRKNPMRDAIWKVRNDRER